MTLDGLPLETRRFVAVAIRERAMTWKKNGLVAPAEVFALADRLYAPPVTVRPPDAADRARVATRERVRRWRARQRGEDVPLRRPGRPKIVTKLDGRSAAASCW